jgi:hypothetical protein
MKPRFSNTQPANTVGRVTAGDEIFANTSYYYASEVVGQTLGTGNGTLTTFSGTLSDADHRPLRKGSIQVTGLLASGVAIAVDDKNGDLTGTHISSGTRPLCEARSCTITTTIGQENFPSSLNLGVARERVEDNLTEQRLDEDFNACQVLQRRSRIWLIAPDGGGSDIFVHVHEGRVRPA